MAAIDTRGGYVDGFSTITSFSGAAQNESESLPVYAFALKPSVVELFSSEITFCFLIESFAVPC